MEDKILKELKQIRQLLSELIGTTDLPASQKFSKEAIAKAAKEFQKMSIERGEWISRDDIDKVIKHAPWHAEKIIIEQFGFANYFKQGHKLYFNRKDLVALNKELNERNISLKVYSALLADQAKFRTSVTSINLSSGDKKRKHFKIPDELRNINSNPYSAQTEELARNEIEALLQEYKKFDLSVYIDLFEGKKYALYKYAYEFDRYTEPKLKKYCEDWCFKFNYANNAMKRMLELKPKDEITEQEVI